MSNVATSNGPFKSCGKSWRGEFFVYEQILSLIREAARTGRVYLTLHANKELKADGLTYDDIVQCLLIGEIVRDRIDPDRNETKYVIYGESLRTDEMAAIVKLGYNSDAVIITVYRLRISDYE
jgi:hypothetical protein